MNPTAEDLVRQAYADARAQREHARKTGRLHAAAIKRRRKRKNGGPK